MLCPNQSPIYVEPSAIVRWEYCADGRAESKEKVSIQSIQTRNDGLESLPDNAFELIDIDPKYRSSIVPESKVSIQNANTVPGIDPDKTLTQKGVQESWNDWIDWNDIFTPLSGQANSENFQPNIYRPHPGSIATPVTQRVADVLSFTAPKWWTPCKIARLPYMGGASMEQVKNACKRLRRQGVVECEKRGKEFLCRSTGGGW
ncbi:hypothetical protein DO97_03720 [Neosynechococcus sphagnicola sy1]|uniref:Uncharacterized protein n=1 Tax=Neosynechococcus sphagnicola sy1 TaxID=1497020 RepID=A0A098TPU1_9CYAN|nr:hypothetical protein DO97_03720 [Neosynechococcus sphagnicola sy1]